MFGNKVGHLGRVGSLTLAQRVSAMFSRGEPGAWYDPSDLSTLFQDAAGTTPVTAVEQPVGRILDKSGRGNHATQSTTTKRPVLSRRVNLYNGSTSSSAVHPLYAAGQVVTTNAALTADGVLRATKAAPNTENNRHSGYTSIVANAPLKISVYAKPAGLNYIEFAELGGNQFGICFNLVGSGSVSGVSGLCSLGNSSITALNDGWYFCETTLTGSVNNPAVGVSAVPSGTPGAYGQLFTGDGINGAYFYDFSIVTAIDAHLPYQHVAAYGIYDADPAKFPAYRRLDGVDDSHASATGGGGTAGFFFSASVTPQGGAGAARTLFSDAGTNTGYIVRLNTSNQLELSAGNGTAYTTIATSGTLAVGTTDVVQAWDDGTNLNVKIGNGATASIARPTVSAGTAGYTMGQDNGASTGYFNGRIYSTIYRKDSGLTQVQRESVALYQRQKARML